MEPIDTYLREWPVISHAPVSAATVILASMIAGFGLGYFVFKERLQTLKERLTHRDERIAELLTKPVASIPPTPPESSRAHRRNSMPDTQLAHAFGYMCETEWGREHNMDEVAIAREVRDKLQMDLLTAFGRIGPDGAPDAIDAILWRTMRLNPRSGNAEMEDGSTAYYDIQLNMKQMRALWPTWRDTYGMS